MKQAQENPWTKVADRYPVDSIVKGKVRNLTNYGAFVELEEGIDGLLHVSDMSWTRKISHPNEMLEKGQEIECKVLSIDQERRRIALGLKQLSEDPWANDIPSRTSRARWWQGQGHEDHQLRCLRRSPRWTRRPAAHFGVGRPQGRESRGEL
jgi:predicted RNA-binding protein with RPS1 domain